MGRPSGSPYGRVVLLGLLCVGAAFAGDGPTTQEAIGWRLFFEPALSGPRNFSCATCHIPSRGYEGGEPLSQGAHGDTLGRNTPTVVNLADAEFFFWDGRAGSLAEQAKGPIANPQEMDMPLDVAVERIRSLRRYREAFAKMGVDEITEDSIADAIAAFEAKLVTGPTKFDRWIHGDREALTEQEERGRVLFFTKGDCALCHNGQNLSDGDFHNIGSSSSTEDVGRSAIEDDAYYSGAFKTPALRNWKGREPFFHDGRFHTMRQVLQYYSNPPEAKVGEREIEPKAFTRQEIDDLLVFLETFNGDWPDLEPYEQAWQALGVE